MIYDTVERAKTRDDVVPEYARMLLDRTSGLEIDWDSVNLLIIEKWSVAGLRYIKAAAYKRAYPNG